jgi:hypothetical protein
LFNVGRRPDGSYSNDQVANFAISCADEPRRPSADEQLAIADDAASRSAYFDDFLRADTGCLGAPTAIDPLIIGAANGAAPILVIGTTGDPATPYEWAVEMADALESAVLFTAEAEGHTSYLGVPCVDEVVDDYLIALELPDDRDGCAADEDIDDFPAPGATDFDKVVALFQCLRDNGADVPEITAADVLADPSGDELFGDFDFDDPGFLTAIVACQALVEDL